jgi:hypothetical protein
MSEQTLVVVYDAEDEVAAQLFRTLLEEDGIAVVERPLESPIFEGVQQFGLHSQLMVREEDAARARRLIEAFEQEAESGELRTEIPEDTGPFSEDTPD